MSRSEDFSRSSKVAARMVGMARKKENLIDSCKLSLAKSPPRIDVKARLVPGIMERAWKIPIRKASTGLSELMVFWELFPGRSRMMMPPMINARATMEILSNK